MISADSKVGAAGPQSGSYVAVDSWANLQLYASSAYEGCTFRASDIGVSGTDFIVKNGVLRVKNYSANALQIHVPDFTTVNMWINFGGSGATYSQTGTTITVTKAAHGLESQFNGASVYIAISTGLAVSGTFTNFTYVDANTFTVTSTVSQSTSGNCASNTAKTYMPWSYTYPTGLIKKGDLLQCSSAWRRCSNSANNKTITFEFGGNAFGSSARTTAGANWLVEASNSAQFVTDSTYITSAVTASPATDSTSTLLVASTLANATDWDLILSPSAVYTPRSPLS